jgi:hypothetical protein
MRSFVRAVHSRAILLTAALVTAGLRGEVGEVTYRAAVWQADVSGGDAQLVEFVTRQVRAAGYAVEPLDSTALTNTAVLDTNRFDLLALPNARILPVEAVPALEGYLRQGGDLLALGLPGWAEPRFQLGGRWLSREAYEAALLNQRPQAALLDLAQADSLQWTRHTNEPQSPARREIITEAGEPTLHVTVANLTSWDLVEPGALPVPFPAGHTLTCFRARGGPRTGQLAVEWIEADGSRWIASVNLSTNWQSYALTPEVFQAWEPRGGRGGAGDRLNVRAVARFTVGVALSHNAIEPGQHEYWLAGLGTAANPFGDAAPPLEPPIPRLESFSPDYLGYPVAGPVTLAPAGFVAPFTHFTGLAVEQPTWVALHPRPRGVGYDQGRAFCWMPVIEAWAGEDPTEMRGTIGTLLVHWRPPYRGGVWALLTPAEPSTYDSVDVRSWVSQLLARLKRGVFLVEGGADQFACFALTNRVGYPPLEHRLGATLVNFGKQPTPELGLMLQAESYAANHGGTAVPRRWTFSLPAGATVTKEWLARVHYPGEVIHKVRATLREGRDVFDSLGHDIWLIPHDPEPRFIEARDGAFWLDGQPWKAHGVNYLPSSGIGVAGDTFEHWLDRGAYDPEIIQRDLARIRAMGLNAVSVFLYHRSLAKGHLLDFLGRCEALGLKVNLSLRPGTPMDFRWAEMKEIIEGCRLAGNDTVFAYDLAWEPSHYHEAYQRQHYTRPWNDWVLARHGSVAAAARAWGEESMKEVRSSKDEVRSSKDEGGRASSGTLLTPPVRFLTHDGPWRRLVADYRQFLDELLAAKYAEARRLVKSIDPHHPVSFRMQYAGDPTFNQPQLLPYDFYGLRDAVDIWEPEAYGRIGTWPQVRPGHFTAAYARLCDPAKPVLWAEMGFDSWDKPRRQPSPQKLEFTARYYADFYRLLIESGADGIFFWWYPGGYRLNEQSDYGIINPDGTDRPVTRVIREWGPKFLAAPKPPPPTEWIEVDRDRDARGLPGLYEAAKAEYWQAVEQGRGVGLRWGRVPGGDTLAPGGGPGLPAE